MVLRIAQELGSKGRWSETGGRANTGGSEMGGRGIVGGSEMGGNRGRKYETADEGCTNRAFSGQPG